MTLLSEYQGMCQVELVGVVVELPNVNPTVLLREPRGQRRELWFPIGQADGVTLAMAWRRTPTPRPLTHELVADIFVRFGLELDVVKITGQSGKTYLAELVLSRDGERQSVSCRPSDALTLALRRLVPAPIMVAEELMQPGSLEVASLEPMQSAWPFDTPEPEVWPPLPSLVPEAEANEEAEAEPTRPEPPS